MLWRAGRNQRKPEESALEGAGEEQAPEGAGEEQAPEGAGEEQALEGGGEEQALEGAGEEQALGLGSKPSPHNPLTSPGAPGGAQVARNWTEPAESSSPLVPSSSALPERPLVPLGLLVASGDTSGLTCAANGGGLELAGNSS